MSSEKSILIGFSARDVEILKLALETHHKKTKRLSKEFNGQTIGLENPFEELTKYESTLLKTITEAAKDNPYKPRNVDAD